MNKSLFDRSLLYLVPLVLMQLTGVLVLASIYDDDHEVNAIHERDPIPDAGPGERKMTLLCGCVGLVDGTSADWLPSGLERSHWSKWQEKPEKEKRDAFVLCEKNGRKEP